MFANTLALIGDCDIVHPHIFPYSPREGTPAARMPQVEPEVRKRRARLLREAGAARRETWLKSLIGTTQLILVERPGDRGHTPAFAEVRLPSPVRPELVEGLPFFSTEDEKNGASTSSARTEMVGSIQPILITGASATTLTGTLA